MVKGIERLSKLTSSLGFQCKRKMSTGLDVDKFDECMQYHVVKKKNVFE